jgi:uncharacterized protein
MFREIIMTPQERQLVDDLFDRLARLESAPRDPDAGAAISQGLRTAPNAIYGLVQTVLVQDEALKRAHQRIQELEAGPAGEHNQSGGGFLDSMRDAIFGANPQQRGSVPNVPPPGAGPRPAWNTGQVLGQQSSAPPYPQPPQGQQYAAPYGGSQSPFGGGGGGGSFLGTAAAAAAGVVGGSLLLSSIRGMMGGGHQSLGDASGMGPTQTPWGGDPSGGSLAQQAGLNDIGSHHGGVEDRRLGALDQNADSGGGYGNDDDRDDMDLDSDDFDGGGDDSDFA